MFTQIASKYPDIKIVAGMDVVPAQADAYSAKPEYPVFIAGGVSDAASVSSGSAAGSGTAAGSATGSDSAVSSGTATSPAAPDANRTELASVDFDVLVDFSHPSMLSAILSLAISRSKPVVLATTGYSDAQIDEIASAAAKIPVFKTANMSIGINLMTELIKTAAALLADNFDIELVESHHNQKLDAPSGTALMLADAMKETLSGELEYVYDRHNVRAKRGKKELGIHSIRGGTNVGEHSVIFAGNDEVLEIRHSASSRGIFAEGAVRAVRFITEDGRSPGLYSMQNLLLDNGN
jgi:4-hydroxy-tetrahydrodipicolinate reductase